MEGLVKFILRFPPWEATLTSELHEVRTPPKGTLLPLLLPASSSFLKPRIIPRVSINSPLPEQP